MKITPRSKHYDMSTKNLTHKAVILLRRQEWDNWDDDNGRQAHSVEEYIRVVDSAIERYNGKCIRVNGLGKYALVPTKDGKWDVRVSDKKWW